MKIGTRSSTMALAQTNEIVAQLKSRSPGLVVEVVKFKPRGDVDQTAKLDCHGGKGGAFVAEIRDAMRTGSLDAAMHSLKDAPGDEEAPGLVFAAYLKRESVEDALVLRVDLSLDDFRTGKGEGFKIGTNSVRRGAYLKHLYPGAEIIHFRGAADTRVQKLDERVPQKLPEGGEVGPADGLIMAKSGLERVGLSERISMVFSPEDMLPAIGQGIVTVECVENNWQTREQLALIDDAESRCCALAEREVLWVLNGHCNTPIAGRATIADGVLRLSAAVLSLDGNTILDISETGDPDRPRELGRAVGMKLLAKGAERIIHNHLLSD